MKKNKIITSILMVSSSNMFLMILGIVMSMVLPLLLNVRDFGYWQLYLYYSGYVGFFIFGFSDGMNLRYAGKDLQDLDKNLFTNFLKYVVLNVVLIFIILVLNLFFLRDKVEEPLVYFAIITNIVIFNINGFFVHINNMTSNFKSYSLFNLLERLLFVLSFPLIFIFKVTDYKYVIFINLLCRIVTLMLNYRSVSPLFTKTDFFNELKHFKSEIWLNIEGGFPLMMATIFAMLMTTVPRVIVEKLFSIEEYGIFSFATSTLNLVIQVIVALSTVFYPTLRRVSEEKQKQLYLLFKDLIVYFSSASMLAYYLIYYIVLYIYPRYESSLSYLHSVFPIILFQSYNSIIVAIYSRILRIEKNYLINNFIFLLFNYIITYVVGLFSKNIIYICIASLLVMFLWMLSSTRVININYKIKNTSINNYMPIIVMSIFVILNSYFDFRISLVIYMLIIFLLTYYYRKIIKSTVKLFLKNSD